MAHERWSRHRDFLITALGATIGAGSVTKFPYLCMRNGGGAFVIVFAFFTIIAAIPCVFLEMVVGQISQGGVIKVWNICPPFKGIGLGMVISTWLFYSYYTMILVWLLFYVYNAFSSTLPWSNCDNPWNTLDCISGAKPINTTHHNVTDFSGNSTEGTFNFTNSMTAAEEFWKFKVLDMTDGLGYLGGIRWPLVGCLLCTHLIVYLCAFRGIKVSGKIAYVTVVIPYLLAIIFLIRGCLLPGSMDGIYFYIYPKFSKFLHSEIWIEACIYSLHSVGVAMGFIVTFSGHNESNNNCFRDAIVVCVVDSLSTIFMGFSFFAIVGHVAFKSGVSVDAFESSGFNLAFIAFPDILTYLPLPQLWSMLAFVMLMTLQIDSLVPTLELLIEAFLDIFPNMTRWRFLVAGGITFISFLVGIVYVTQGGIYVLTLVDWYAYFPSLALYAMLECLVVGWFYGTKKLQNDISIMCGRRTPNIVMVAIRFFCPVLLLVILCNSVYSYRPPKYGDYIYPTWATSLGWMISSVSILPFPTVFLWTLYKTPGNTLKQKFLNALKTNRLWRLPEEEVSPNDVPLEQVSQDGQEMRGNIVPNVQITA